MNMAIFVVILNRMLAFKVIVYHFNSTKGINSQNNIYGKIENTLV